MGFGHRIYKVRDPRAKVLGEAAEKLVWQRGDAVGIPSEIFTPTFAISRTAGWTAHVLEQFADNLLIRPESVYVGPRGRMFVPVEQR
jgi:citrate synthase